MFFNAFVLPVLFAVTLPNPVQNANILAFLPAEGRSHVVPFHPLFRELALRGHNVTLLSYFPIKTPTPNLTNIKIEADIPIFGIPLTNLRTYSSLFHWKYIHDEVQSYYSKLLRDKQLVDFFNSTDTRFDLVFTELYHLDAVFAIGQRYDCPVIGVSVQPLLTNYQWLLGSPTTFSYVPHSYLPYTDHMTFWQRSVNAFFGAYTLLYYNFISIPAYQKDVDFTLAHTGQRIPSIQELTRDRLALALVESHFSSSYSQPSPPNVIDVAGIHLERSKPLPQDIQIFMDEAEHGVIFVSLGSLVNPQLAVELGTKLLKLFKTFPQRVIWKWKMDTTDGVNGNVMVREWLPQLDILSHPKCRLFISHGGYHSITEAIYSGIPILGLPFFTDQYHNMAIVLSKNIGKKCDLDSDVTELQQAVDEILRDDTYRQRCQTLSRIFRDRPVSPLDTAVFWTEYVLRHKGAHHLKTAAQDLYWYEYLLLDVILIPILAVGSLMFLILFILMKLRNMLRSVIGRNSSVPKSREKYD